LLFSFKEDFYIYFFTVNSYWDQWPLVNDEFNDEERVKLYSIPDIDIPPSPPRQIISSPITQPSTTTENNNILDILTRPSSLPKSNRTSNYQIKKRKKKKETYV